MRVFAAIAVLATTANAGGCITLRSGPSQTLNLQNCSTVTTEINGECCELYDRREVAKQWASRLNPVKLVPQRVYDWTGNAKSRSSQFIQNQHGRCLAACDSMHGWIHKKKEEANPPPWPRFHPVPTHPAFEPQDGMPSDAPGEFGRFGKEQ